MWMPAPTCRRMGSSKSGSKQQGTADTFADPNPGQKKSVCSA